MPEALLYHYTSLEAFINIIDRNELWASDLSVVNDPAELIHVRSRFYALCENVIKGQVSFSAKDQERREFASRLVGSLQTWVEKDWEVFGGHIFAVSFCQRGDLLSQWRGYGLEGNGVCIGFNPELLNSSFSNARLVTISYDEKELVDCLYGLLEQAFERHGPKISSLEDFASALSHITDGLAHHSHRFKLSSFKEEAEVRLVSILSGSAEENVWKIMCRLKNNVLIPYVVNAPIEGLLAIKMVITGPAFKAPSSVYALKAMLERKGHKEVLVVPSQFGLR